MKMMKKIFNKENLYELVKIIVNPKIIILFFMLYVVQIQKRMALTQAEFLLAWIVHILIILDAAFDLYVATRDCKELKKIK